MKRLLEEFVHDLMGSNRTDKPSGKNREITTEIYNQTKLTEFLSREFRKFQGP